MSAASWCTSDKNRKGHALSLTWKSLHTVGLPASLRVPAANTGPLGVQLGRAQQRDKLQQGRRGRERTLSGEAPRGQHRGDGSSSYGRQATRYQQQPQRDSETGEGIIMTCLSSIFWSRLTILTEPNRNLGAMRMQVTESLEVRREQGKAHLAGSPLTILPLSLQPPWASFHILAHAELCPISGLGTACSLCLERSFPLYLINSKWSFHLHLKCHFPREAFPVPCPYLSWMKHHCYILSQHPVLFLHCVRHICRDRFIKMLFVWNPPPPADCKPNENRGCVCFSQHTAFHIHSYWRIRCTCSNTLSHIAHDFWVWTVQQR